MKYTLLLAALFGFTRLSWLIVLMFDLAIDYFLSSVTTPISGISVKKIMHVDL